MMATPWVCDGRPVFGYTVTNVDSADERRRGSRDTYAHEFWIYDSEKGMPRKLDDVYPNGYRLNNADGKDVSVTEAVNQMKKFATAATYHPHVFMAPEFTEARNYVNGRFGLPPVTAKDYETYLREKEHQLQSGDFTFVGKITKLSDMHIAYESMEGMDEYEKKMRKKGF